MSPDPNAIIELDRAECLEVLANERLCIMALTDGEQPYAIPVFYGFDGESVWLGISEGRKTALLDRNARVCVSVNQVGPGDAWRSVMVSGTARFISDPEERKRGIEVLMAHNRKFAKPAAAGSSGEGAAAAPPQRRHSGGRMLVIAEAVVTGRAKR
jgi:nitroimidazol reductase NimA-like FMN-containing flavoprotein (pyridoxamine 5'-phosphate oxidase superfamily)